MKYCSNDACPDLLRNGFRSEYLDHVETCPECDGRLTAGPAAPPPSARPKTTEWVDTVCVATFSDLPSAQVARASLESAGILAVVEHEHTQGLYPQAIGLRLCVPPEHVEEATRILASDDAELVEDVAEALPVIEEGSPSATAEEDPQKLVASPYQTTETLAIFLIACGYPLVADGLWQSEIFPPPTVGEFATTSLWDIGWVVLICCLLTRDRTFRWNLPATRPEWLVEAAWGVALYFVATGASRLFVALARDIGLDSAPTRWDQWLTDRDLLLAFRFFGPLAALNEELLFRVYLQTRLTLIFRGWSLISVPTCAGLFALTHNYAPVQTAGVFGAGLAFGISYQVSRKVPRIAIAHAISSMFRAT